MNSDTIIGILVVIALIVGIPMLDRLTSGSSKHTIDIEGMFEKDIKKYAKSIARRYERRFNVTPSITRLRVRVVDIEEEEEEE